MASNTLQDVDSPVFDAPVEAPIPRPKRGKKRKLVTSDDVELPPLAESILEPPMTTPVPTPRTSTPVSTSPPMNNILNVKITNARSMTLTKGYTTLYCHPGVIVALAKYLPELTKALHDRELVDYKLSSNVHVSTRDYKNGIFIALTKWRMDDTTNMMQPTNTSLFLRSEEVRILLLRKEEVEELLGNREDSPFERVMEIAVQAYAGVLYDDVCDSVRSDITQAQPVEFETPDILGLAKDLYAKVSENKFFDRFYTMTLRVRCGVPTWMLYFTVKDNKCDEVLNAIKAMM